VLAVASSSPIKSPRLKPHLDIEKLVGVVWSSRTSSGCGDLQIVKELYRRFIFLLHLNYLTLVADLSKLEKGGWKLWSIGFNWFG
jgi:hypothetical protein